MPQIIVIAEPAQDGDSAVVHRERVSTTHLESDHSAAQIVERITWAVSDAENIERDTGSRAGLGDGWVPV